MVGKEITDDDWHALPQVRKCSRCGVTKTAAQFYRDRRQGDGLTSPCKECHGRCSAATICTVPGCTEPHKAKGLCNKQPGAKQTKRSETRSAPRRAGRAAYIALPLRAPRATTVISAPHGSAGLPPRHGTRATVTSGRHRPRPSTRCAWCPRW
jgi:hypothetical protein